MAARSNISVAKNEKKATPSSNSRSTYNKTTNNTIRGAGNVANKVKTTTSSIHSSPSTKSVPSYLRPTSSSTKSDSSTPTKKTTNEIYSSQNAARRRSFDRPPSAIRNQKSFVSPDLKDRVIPREKILPTRSSSFSHSSTPKVPASKRVLERNSKSLKPIRSPSSTHVWRKTTSSLKNGSNASSSSSTKSSPKGNVEETKLQSEAKESHIEEAINVESEDDNIQKVEIKEDTSVDSSRGIENIEEGTTIEDHLANISNHPTENVDSIEASSNISEENHEEEIYQTNEQEDNQEKEQSNNGDTYSEDQRTETETLELKGQEEKDETPIENSGSTLEEGEKKTEQETNAPPKEAKTIEEGTKTEEKEANNGVQKAQGKRETPTAYNDVIEETKNKLLEKRKNKVKALVGAFETVIDYETAGSNSNK